MDQRVATVFRPFRGLVNFMGRLPTAYAVGCILSPLRGWHRALSELFPSRKPLNPQHLSESGKRGRGLPRYTKPDQPRWGQRAQRISRFLLRQRRGFDLRRRTFRQESRRHQVSRYFSNRARDWRRVVG